MNALYLNSPILVSPYHQATKTKTKAKTMALPNTTPIPCSTNNNSNSPRNHPTNPQQQQGHSSAVTNNNHPPMMPPPRGYISSRSHIIIPPNPNPNPNPNPPRGGGGGGSSSFSSYGGGGGGGPNTTRGLYHPDPHPPPPHLPLLLHSNNNYNNNNNVADHPVIVRGLPTLPLSSSSSYLLQTVPSPAPVPDSNGYKDPRSKEDSFVTVRDRKVRVSASSSLYAACRSWLRNGVSEETQPHYLDGIKLLPKPSPPPVPDAHSPAEPTKEEEEEESIEHLSPKDLLKRHVKRAKKVRARHRDERLQRIARYKTRLALLLPPLVEQQHQFRNEFAAGN